MSDEREAREPPWSATAEQSLLGAVLLDNGALDRVADVVQPGDFYAVQHRAIWATVTRLIAAGKAADVVTMFEAGQHDLAYLNELAECVVSSANAHRYAAIVRDRSIERAMVQASGRVIELAHAQGMEVADKVDQAQAAFAVLAERRSGTQGEAVTIDNAALELIDYVSAMAEGKNPAISTGLRRLDRATGGGIRPGELWVLGARPKMGKTALALHLQRAMSREHATLFLSQEMPVLQLTMRHVAALAGLNMEALRQPRQDDHQLWERLSESTELLRGLNMLQDSQGGLSLLDVRRRVLKAKRSHGVGVVFIDYLQLMVGDGDNRNAELDRISNGLKAMAMEFGVGVVLLSQLSRKADERSGPPVMGDLRDSGAIEAAADLIGMLYRDCVRTPTEENLRHAQLEIVAQRNGPSGTVHLEFVGEHQRFNDWPVDVPYPSKRAAKVSVIAGGLD